MQFILQKRIKSKTQKLFNQLIFCKDNCPAKILENNQEDEQVESG